MSRREFVGWMLAATAAMVAGSRIWRLFRAAVEERPDVVWASIRSNELVTNAIGEITAIDRGQGTITVTWRDQHNRPWHGMIERGSEIFHYTPVAPITADDYSFGALSDLMARA